MRVSVNISYTQFRSGNFVKIVKEVLQKTRLSAEFLELELTESVLMHNTETVIKTLSQLKDIGVSISIDDFGAGFSSLNYLRQLPIDLIKIDRSFIQEIQSRQLYRHDVSFENPEYQGIILAGRYCYRCTGYSRVPDWRYGD